MKISKIRIPYPVLILVIIGLLLLFVGLYDVFRVYCTKGWPTVQGQIEASEILEKEVSSFDTVYYLAIRYSYVVEGKRLEGTRISYGDAIGDESKDDSLHSKANFLLSLFSPAERMPYGDTMRSTIEPFAEQYSVGKVVNVHYKPNDPSVAVINTSFGWSNTRTIVWAMLCFVASAFTGFFHWFYGLLGKAIAIIAKDKYRDFTIYARKEKEALDDTEIFGWSDLLMQLFKRYYYFVPGALMGLFIWQCFGSSFFIIILCAVNSAILVIGAVACLDIRDVATCLFSLSRPYNQLLRTIIPGVILVTIGLIWILVLAYFSGGIDVLEKSSSFFDFVSGDIENKGMFYLGLALLTLFLLAIFSRLWPMYVLSYISPKGKENEPAIKTSFSMTYKKGAFRRFSLPLFLLTIISFGLHNWFLILAADQETAVFAVNIIFFFLVVPFLHLMAVKAAYVLYWK